MTSIFDTSRIGKCNPRLHGTSDYIIIRLQLTECRIIPGNKYKIFGSYQPDSPKPTSTSTSFQYFKNINGLPNKYLYLLWSIKIHPDIPGHPATYIRYIFLGSNYMIIVCLVQNLDTVELVTESNSTSHCPIDCFIHPRLQCSVTNN